MKKKLVGVFMMLCTVGLLAASSSANAYYCKWVGGHYVNGRYVSGHQVCYHNRGYAHCGWRNGHKVCWN